jgi:hypothetical protein
MPEFLFKRIVHVEEYYRIMAEDEAEGYRKIDQMLNLLAERLTVFQDESFPTERVVALEENDHVELVESLSPDDGEDPTPHSLEAANTILRCDLVMQSDRGQLDGYPITPETLQQLPPFVAAVVCDYSTHEEEQHWFLHDIQYDLQGLDPLPIDEDSTCEIWVQGWVWRGRNGTISLSPFMAQPQGAELEEAFAWAVERENTDTQHIHVRRIRCPELQVPDSHVQTQTVETTQQKTLSKQDVFVLARLFQEQEKLMRVVRMVEMAYGKECQVARIILQGGEDPLGGGTRYRHLDSLTVFDRNGNELSPDFGLPFWQERSDLDLILARPGDEHYSNAADSYGDPADGTPAHRLAAAIDELIQKEYGPLDAEVRYEINLESEETQMLLHLPFPQIFGHVPLLPSTEIDPRR